MKTFSKRKVLGGLCFVIAAACWTWAVFPASSVELTALSPREASAILGAGVEDCTHDACNWGCVYGQGGWDINTVCGEVWHAGSGDAGWRCSSGIWVCTPSGTPASWTVKRCWSNMMGECVTWSYASCTGEGSICIES